MVSIRNLVYLIGFFILYFPLVVSAIYALNVVCGGNGVTGISIFVNQCNQIPSSTFGIMYLLLFGAVPIAAIFYTFTFTNQPDYNQ